MSGLDRRLIFSTGPIAQKLNFKIHAGHSTLRPGVLMSSMNPPTPTGAKVCTACGQDVSHRRRIKDPNGRYFCEPCAGIHSNQGWHIPTSSVAPVLNPPPTPFAYKVAAYAGIGGGIALIFGLSLYLFLDGRWGRLHRDEILALKEKADSV